MPITLISSQALSTMAADRLKSWLSDTSIRIAPRALLMDYVRLVACIRSICNIRYVTNTINTPTFPRKSCIP